MLAVDEGEAELKRELMAQLAQISQSQLKGVPWGSVFWGSGNAHFPAVKGCRPVWLLPCVTRLVQPTSLELLPAGEQGRLLTTVG